MHAQSDQASSVLIESLGDPMASAPLHSVTTVAVFPSRPDRRRNVQVAKAPALARRRATDHGRCRIEARPDTVSLAKVTETIRSVG
jgi:hypothetical protein